MSPFAYTLTELGAVSFPDIWKRERSGKGRPFSVITVEVPGDINTMGGPGDIWEVRMELYPFAYA